MPERFPLSTEQLSCLLKEGLVYLEACGRPDGVADAENMRLSLLGRLRHVRNSFGLRPYQCFVSAAGPAMEKRISIRLHWDE